MDHRDHDGLVMAVLHTEKDTKQNLYYTTPLLVFLVAIKKRERGRHSRALFLESNQIEIGDRSCS